MNDIGELPVNLRGASHLKSLHVEVGECSLATAIGGAPNKSANNATRDQNGLLGPAGSKGEKRLLPSALPTIDEGLIMKCLSDRIHTESKFIISLFDFGGQSVFNVIHHFFLTKYGVYLLVFNMEWLVSGKDVEKDNCLAYLSFWLNSVVIHTQNASGQTAPIAFVGTRKGMVSSPGQHEAISTILYNEFSGSLAGPHIVENEHAKGRNRTTDLYFFPVDNTLSRKDPTSQKLEG
ncbi:hypothetical protein EON65_51290 [archaeon]|nr:MAG: hypothetical protein EON65_51290 [archaeon]